MTSKRRNPSDISDGPFENTRANMLRCITRSGLYHTGEAETRRKLAAASPDRYSNFVSLAQEHEATVDILRDLFVAVRAATTPKALRAAVKAFGDSWRNAQMDTTRSTPLVPEFPTGRWEKKAKLIEHLDGYIQRYNDPRWR